MWHPSDPGRGSPWLSTGRVTCRQGHLSAGSPANNITLKVIVIYRHQKNGAVIARCSQPEISWWGWRNTDDEYLVTSIAKACQMGTKGAWRQRGEAPESSDSDFGKKRLFFQWLVALLLSIMTILAESSVLLLKTCEGVAEAN